VSGGSFDYLYMRALDEVLARQTDLHSMADTLESEFPGSAAARDTRALVDELTELWRRWEAEPLRKLRDGPWYAIEWWQSNDWGRDQAEAAIREYGPPGRRPIRGVLLHCPQCAAHVRVEADDDEAWHYAEHPLFGQVDGSPCPVSGRTVFNIQPWTMRDRGQQ
jgi:hypothetical protein